MPRAPWNERKAVSISVNPLSVSLRKPGVPLRTSPLKPFSGSFSPLSPCFRLSLLLTLEGHKVREEHHCHSTSFSLDVKQRSCNQPAVLWEIPVQELVPSTEFNFNGCWPSHLKAETCVGPVVEASHGQVNSAKNGGSGHWITVRRLTEHLLGAWPCAGHYGSYRVAMSPDVDVRWV